MKKSYDYKRIEGEGAIGELPYPHQYESMAIFRTESVGKRMVCPYTDFVPLQYAINGGNVGMGDGSLMYIDTLDRDIRQKNIKSGIKKRWEYTLMGRIIQGVYTNSMLDTFPLRKQALYDGIGKYLMEDRPMPLYGLLGNIWGTTESLVESFKEGRSGTFGMNSYQAAIGVYSLCYKNHKKYDYVSGNQIDYIPYMLAVVLPENVLSVRYSILTKGVIPLDRVIVLVAKEMDNVEFEPPAFRAFFRKLYSHVLTTKCQIWKVPLSFIEEKCFLPPFSLKEKSIVGRKKEIEGAIGEYLKWLKGELLSLPEQPSPIPSPVDTVSTTTFSVSIDPETYSFTYRLSSGEAVIEEIPRI